jgi:hypothetical protein
MNTLHDIEQYLNNISQLRFSQNIRVFYRVMAKPTVGTIRYLQLVCKFCSAMFSLSRKHSELVLVTRRLEHTHETLKYKSKLENAVMSFIRENHKPNTSIAKELRIRAEKEFSITSYQFRKLASKFEEAELNSFAYLK